MISDLMPPGRRLVLSQAGSAMPIEKEEEVVCQ